MKAVKIVPVQAKPEFDIMYYMAVSGSNRIQHDLLEKFEKSWMDWKDRLRTFKLIPAYADGDEGFVLVFLPEQVEEMVEDAWGRSQEEGAAFHNLAITMVMAAVQSLVPELLELGCVPLPKPSKHIQEAFEEVGLSWNPMTANTNRQYAAFTPYPFRGSCEICFQSDTCPNSTMRSDT